MKRITNQTFPSWLINRACLSKQSYSKSQADNMVDFKAAQGIVLLYYKCAFCNSYHLTKNKELKDTNEFLQII